MGVLADAGVSVALGVGVGVTVYVGACEGVSWGLVGKGMMVGSGGTSCPHADSRSTATAKHRTELAATALLIPCFLFITQGLNRVEARCSQCGI